MEARRLGFWVLGVVVFAVSTSAIALYVRHGAALPFSTVLDQAALNEKLRDGDLIFRRGRDAISDAVLTVDGASPFSHVGIVAKRQGKVYVIHAVPSEQPGRNDGVVIDTLSFFTDPQRAESFAVYRVSDLSFAVAQKAAQHAETMIGRPFDDNFDLNEQGRLYCTELVWAAYRSQGVTLIHEPDTLHVPFIGGKFILPRTLLSSGLLSRVHL